MSKKLDSILNTVPYATASHRVQNEKKIEKNERIVASIPKSLKDEIRSYIEEHEEETERSVVLKALKCMGFSVNDQWIVDRRKTR